MKNDIIAINVSKEYILYIDKVLERSKLEIIEWFEKPYQEFKVKAFIYQDIPSLREGLHRRGFGPYPEYMNACMIDENQEQGIERSINLYEPSIKGSDTEYSRKEYNSVVFHELVHYITDIYYGKLPEWLTEGIAKYLDGSYKTDLTNLMTIIKTYEIPDISTMQGDTFILKTQEKTIYDGYDLSYIMVRYIIEVYGKDYLFSLMQNKEEISTLAQTTLIEAIEYFNSLYLKENTIKSQKI